MALLTDALIVFGVYTAAKSGLLGPTFQAAAAQIDTALAPLYGQATGRAVPCPTAQELAAKLGVTVYRVQTAMAKSGKTGCTLSLADLQGIPDLPSSVNVGGVASIPNAQGPPASWQNPTGGSGTWGGLTDKQIQQAYLNANGGDPTKAQAAWSADHAKEVAARGF